MFDSYDPMDCSPPGTSVYGIFQARILKWVAISFSRVSFWSKDQTLVSWIASGFFTNWDTREALFTVYLSIIPFNRWIKRCRDTENAMAMHSSTLAWKIPWTEEPGRLQSMGLLRVGHDWATSLSLFTFMRWRRKWHQLQYSCLENSRDRGA